MPKTDATIPVSGIYRPACCGIDWMMLANHTFPPCGGGKPECKGPGATWTVAPITARKYPKNAYA